MDAKGSGGMFRGLLGSSDTFKQRKNKVEGSDRAMGQRNQDEFSDDVHAPINFEVSNSSADKKPCDLKGKEKPKLHRRGSLIDWGASKFDFSRKSKRNELGGSQTSVNYSQDDSSKLIISSNDSFLSPLSSNKKNDYTALRYNRTSPDMSPISENEILEAPMRRQKSILGIIEDQKFEAAPQAFLSGDNKSISNIEKDENSKSSVLGGLMGSWFFKKQTIDEDNVSDTMQYTSQIPMEGIGGGALTSKVILELNNSKAEGGKINTWMPASF